MNSATAISASERRALAFCATLSVPVRASQTFSPLLPIHYRDGAGTELEGRPDALAIQGKSFTFIESKNGKLNFHISKASSHKALQEAYTLTMHDDRDKSYNFLTEHFYLTNPRLLHDHAWNHSLFKVLALQAEHGWQRYVVCFDKTPSKRDAKRYLEAGLVFCTLDTLLDMLRTIELAQHGIFVPFVFFSKRAKYGFTVTADYRDVDQSVDSVRASERAKFVAAVGRSMTEMECFF